VAVISEKEMKKTKITINKSIILKRSKEKLLLQEVISTNNKIKRMIKIRVIKEKLSKINRNQNMKKRINTHRKTDSIQVQRKKLMVRKKLIKRNLRLASQRRVTTDSIYSQMIFDSTFRFD
jgi:hypothetical protein